MTVTARSEYALRALRYLGRRFPDGEASSREIAEGEGIPEVFLKQIMVALRRRGIVRGTRGVKGGYSLAKAPDKLTIRAIIEATEGGVEKIFCLERGQSCLDFDLDCRLKHIWNEALAAFRVVLDSYTLADIIKREEVLGKVLAAAGSGRSR